MKTRTFRFSLAIGLTGLAFAFASANAATVLIDFSAAAVAPSPDSNSNHWNSFGSIATSGSASAITVTNLIPSNGIGTTPWSVFVDHQGGTSGNRTGFGGTGINGPVGATAPFNTTGADRPTVDGVFAHQGLSLPITFSGLLANSNYDFQLIGGRGGNTADGLITLTAGAAVSGLDGSNQGVIQDTGAILSFTATATAGGQITFAYSAPTANGSNVNNTLNAMSITGSAIPEPGSLTLLGLGALSLLRRRR